MNNINNYRFELFMSSASDSPVRRSGAALCSQYGPLDLSVTVMPALCFLSVLLSNTMATPERQARDPDMAAGARLGSMRCTGGPKLFRSGSLCCLLNKDPCCQVWTSHLEAIHWPSLCLITFFCTRNIRRPVPIWHQHHSIGWHLRSAIVGWAGKPIVQRVLLQWATVRCRFVS